MTGYPCVSSFGTMPKLSPELNGDEFAKYRSPVLSETQTMRPDDEMNPTLIGFRTDESLVDCHPLVPLARVNRLPPRLESAM
mmetsp:Transcript_44260/g.172300  ORF Transcript_44260/g.172300 Transcript_44260/m.172300 type:complete len:82 (-) Transcript_44260:548-793(-)